MTTLPASVRVIDLPAATTITGAEMLEVVQTGVGGTMLSVQIPLTAFMTSTLGALPTGGGTSQILGKSSGGNYSTAWYDVTTFISVNTTTGLATAGTGTALVMSISSGGVGSNQLGTFAVQAANVATNAIGNVQIRQGSPLSIIGVAGNATANVADIVAAATPGDVLQVNAGGTGLTFTGIVNSSAFLGITNTGLFAQSGTVLATGTFGIVGTTLITGLFGVVGTTNFTGVHNVVGTTLFTSGTFGIVGTTLITGTFSQVGTSLMTGLFGVVGTSQFTGTFNVVGTTLFTSNTFGIVGTTLVTGILGVVGTTIFTSGAFGVVGTSIFTGSFALGSQATGLLISSGTGAISATTNFPIGFTFNTFSVGNIGTTTFTAVPSNGNYQRYFNNAAHTVSSFTTSDHAIDVLVTNTTGAGSITFNGFTVNTSNIGDALTTTNGNQFIIALRRMGGTATYVIKALQ